MLLLNARQKESRSNLIQWTGLDLFPFGSPTRSAKLFPLLPALYTPCSAKFNTAFMVPRGWFRGRLYVGCDLASFHLMQPSLSVRSRGFKATPSFHQAPSGTQLSGSYLRELLPAPCGQYAPCFPFTRAAFESAGRARCQ